MITWWYRPLEIIHGSDEYTEKVDIWSFGCILGELVKQKPLFPG